MIVSGDHIPSYSKNHLEVIFKSTQNIVYNQLTIQQLDCKLKNLVMDIHSMSILIKQIKNNLFNSSYPLKMYQSFSIRFLILINQIFELYGIDKFTFVKVNKYIKICNAQWKKLLQRAVFNIKKSSINQIFLYKTNRNNYLYSMLRTNNTILLKMMDRLLLKNYFNKKVLKYLRQSAIKTSYEYIYSKIIIIMEEKEEQTGLKILLINQFLKFILFYLNLCLKQSQFQNVFAKFFTVVLQTCRYIKKMQADIKRNLITESLGLIRQGLNYYMAILKKNKKNCIKIQQLKYIVQVIDETPNNNQYQKDHITLHRHKNAVPIRIILKIMDCWKIRWKQNKQAAANTNELQEIKKITKKGNVQQAPDQNRNVSRSLFQKKQCNNQQKQQTLNLNKSINKLKRRSSSLKQLGHLKSKGYILSQLLKDNVEVSNKPTLKNQKLQQSFQKIDAMKLFKNYSINDKGMFRAIKQNQIKQLKIQDYQIYRQNKIKNAKDINKIMLFKGTNMLLGRNKGNKLKLGFKGTMRELQ